MKIERIRSLCSIGLLVILALLAAGSVDMQELMTQQESEVQPDLHPGGVPDGNRILIGAGTGTTVQKNSYEEQHVGKSFRFGGSVTDVTSEQVATIQLGIYNHATVTFDHSVAHLRKGQYVTFDATIDSFGGGIVINHRLKEARLVSLSK